MFQINGLVDSLIYPISSVQKILSIPDQGFPSRQWLMSQISMVTFDQRSANSLISRLITNRAEHIGSPLILAGENAVLGERKRKGGRRAQWEVGAVVAVLSPSASFFP